MEMLCKSANGFMVFIVYLAYCRNFQQKRKEKRGKVKLLSKNKTCSSDNFYYVES